MYVYNKSTSLVLVWSLNANTVLTTSSYDDLIIITIIYISCPTDRIWNSFLAGCLGVHYNEKLYYTVHSVNTSFMSTNWLIYLNRESGIQIVLYLMEANKIHDY